MYKLKNFHKHSLLFPLAIVFFEIILYFSNDAFLPAIPCMMHDLHFTITEAQLTISLWFIGSAVTTLFVGILSDHYGRRPIILLGTLIYTIASFFLMVTTNKYTFLIFRLLQGSMVSFLTVPGYAAIHESFDNKEATKILALMGSVTIIAPAFGPLLGGIILQLSNWRYIFASLFILGILSSLLIFSYVVETLALEKRQSLILKDAFSSYYRVLKNKHFFLYNIVLALIFGGFISWVTLSPMLLLEKFSFSTIGFGFIQIIVFSCYISGSKVVKYLLGKDYCRKQIISIALLINIIASGLGCLVSYYFPDNFYYFLPCMMGYSFGAALCFPILGRLAVESSDEPMGRRTGLQSTIMMIFASLSTAGAGLLYTGELFGLARFIVFAAILAFLVHRLLETSSKEAQEQGFLRWLMMTVYKR